MQYLWIEKWWLNLRKKLNVFPILKWLKYTQALLNSRNNIKQLLRAILKRSFYCFQKKNSECMVAYMTFLFLLSVVKMKNLLIRTAVIFRVHCMCTVEFLSCSGGCKSMFTWKSSSLQNPPPPPRLFCIYKQICCK